MAGAPVMARLPTFYKPSMAADVPQVVIVTGIIA